jgi:hypothetical protein
VKFVAFWEYDAEVAMKVIEKLKQMTAEREKGTERVPKLIFGPFNFAGETKGFSVYETDDPDKLTNMTAFYMPELRMKIIPIQESARAAELYVKMKK